VVHGFQTLIITKRELQLAIGIIVSCHDGAFSSSKQCVWSLRKSIEKNVTQKNQNNYYETNIATCILILIFLIFLL